MAPGVARAARHAADVRYHYDPATGVMTVNAANQAVPAIPIPIPFGFTRVACCECAERFWSARTYRGHYALEHILGLE